MSFYPSVTLTQLRCFPYFPQLRHIDSAQGGSMQKKVVGSAGLKNSGTSDLHIAYLSQQQLRSFNLPYQLGYTDIPDTPNSFESPTDADTASISGTHRRACPSPSL